MGELDPGVGATTGSVSETATARNRRSTRLDEPPPSFVRDVLPALHQAGCASGGCHAKPEGQSGFKLSVFAHDPAGDHAEIVRDARKKRRANR